MAKSAPAYDPYQTAFHEAFRPELYRILDDLPLSTSACVLDVPCGNGFYTRHLSERLAKTARLVAVDASETYVEMTQKVLAKSHPAARVEVQQADAYHLPHEGQTFDLVWCAQSLISLDPVRAVRELYRVVKANGAVAVLEVDEYHHVLLSWPAELEAAFPQALHTASVQKYEDGVKLSPTRRLRHVLRQCGFQSVRRSTYSIERVAPYDQLTLTFLDRHFEYLRSLVYPHLSSSLRKTFERATDPSADDSLYRLTDSELVCINAMYLARP